MALLLSDSFDHYTTISQKWLTTYGSCSIGGSYGRLGTNGLKINTGDAGVGFKPPAGKSTVIVGQAVYFENVTDTHILLTLYDDDDDDVQVVVKQEGANIKVYCGATEISSAAHGMSASIWYYVEIKILIASGTGTVDVKVDTVSKIADTGKDTQNTSNDYCTDVVLGGMGTGASSYTYRDDVVVMDTADSYCNNFLGDVIIQCISPTGVGSNTDWTPSSGSNFECVNEKPPNTGDYIESATLNDVDTYVTENVSPLTGSVFAVVVNMFAQKVGTAARGISGACLETGTTTLGNEITLDAAYKMRQSMMYENERTSAAFTIDDINNAQFGVKLTT
jgi:hypothetical protein